MLKYLLPVLALIAAPAEARDWGMAGGWTIGEANADTCGMLQEFEGEGETELVLGVRTDGSVFMSVSNYGWSTNADQAYDLIYYLNGTAYDGGRSTGRVSGIRKGFVTAFEPDFLQHFAASTYLTIKSRDGVTIDDLNLEGSAAALAQVRRCVAHLRAVQDAAARERARFAHIPRDPFAVVQGEPVTPPSPVETGRGALPQGNLTGLFREADYPSSAAERGQEGTTRVLLTIGADGRVTGCTVTGSSGSSALDSATCRVLRSRARFTPAKDASGNPRTDTLTAEIPWTLPDS